LDTGALIGLERGARRIIKVVKTVSARGGTITVPTVVAAEWWRGQRGPAARLLWAFDVEPLSLQLARIAGEALAAIGSGPSVVDAVVMASAAQRGDIVLTSDVADLSRLSAVFPEVRLLGV
jgi:predicted nucleic acid-binding protein